MGQVAAASYYGVEEGEIYEFELSISFTNDTIDGELTISWSIEIVDIDDTEGAEYLEIAWDWSDDTEALSGNDLADVLGRDGDYWEAMFGEDLFEDPEDNINDTGSVSFGFFIPGQLDSVGATLILSQMDEDQALEYSDVEEGELSDGSTYKEEGSTKYDEMGVLTSYTKSESWTNATDEEDSYEYEYNIGGGGIPSYPAMFVGGFSIMAIAAVIMKMKHKK